MCTLPTGIKANKKYSYEALALQNIQREHQNTLLLYDFVQVE